MRRPARHGGSCLETRTGGDGRRHRNHNLRTKRCRRHGPSAARLHGAIPRALATATIAVPSQHRAIELSDRPAVVRFIERETARLDAERINTQLGPTLVTTPEQTVLDLAHRPELGEVALDVPTAVATLFGRCDEQRIAALAQDQRRTASLRRAEAWAQT
ncbi:type IV toxin-antitoxin system AbiEi family antitoxin [Mycobacteroides abscessus]|uniref:type IV toxin-antitoxin system AbiEi family antitoxin n=1 Tax=Mycobacteroides abscessus TaxID=36809 RepID=UPI001F3BA3A3|nr:type IV toxin-antitoxin system AbiEi family antitoxin [Mycobacteroides abscessus]